MMWFQGKKREKNDISNDKLCQLITGREKAAKKTGGENNKRVFANNISQRMNLLQNRLLLHFSTFHFLHHTFLLLL